MNITNEHKAMIASYVRSVIGAVCAVASTGNYQFDDITKAALAALIPPLLRWANTNDPAFGRGS